VTAAAGAPVLFESTIAPLGRTSARVVDFGACMASVNGAARPMSTHVVDLSGGYAAASSRYSDSNQRLIRQAAERGVRVDVLDDARASACSTTCTRAPSRGTTRGRSRARSSMRCSRRWCPPASPPSTWPAAATT